MRALLIILLAGCGGGLKGEWTGECEIFADPGIWLVDVQVDIDRYRAGRASGEGSLVMHQSRFPELADYTFDGPATAERDGDDVEIRLEGIAGGFLVELNVQGEIDGDDIDGDCTVDYVGDAVGDLELDR